MHNDVMSIMMQMDWIKQCIMDQVDAQAELLQSNDPDKLLACSQVIVSAIIDKIDVAHVLGIYYHIVEQAVDKETWVTSADRLQCVYDHFNQWIELELATRYA